MLELSARPYYELKPFLELFRTGVPILMYHKIGERPRGVRLKGLYVSAPNFVRQLEEFREAGFAAYMPSECLTDSSPSLRVVLTFDDATIGQFRYLPGGSR